MPEESGLDKLTKLGERVRKAFESKPKETPAPVSDSTQKAIAKAVGPRFQATPKKVEPTPAKETAKKPTRKRTKKGPTKY